VSSRANPPGVLPRASCPAGNPLSCCAFGGPPPRGAGRSGGIVAGSRNNSATKGEGGSPQEDGYDAGDAPSDRPRERRGRSSSGRRRPRRWGMRHESGGGRRGRRTWAHSRPLTGWTVERWDPRRGERRAKAGLASPDLEGSRVRVEPAPGATRASRSSVWTGRSKASGGRASIVLHGRRPGPRSSRDGAEQGGGGSPPASCLPRRGFRRSATTAAHLRARHDRRFFRPGASRGFPGLGPSPPSGRQAAAEGCRPGWAVFRARRRSSPPEADPDSAPGRTHASGRGDSSPAKPGLVEAGGSPGITCPPGAPLPRAPGAGC